MAKLSNYRRDNAKRFGAAVARSHLQDYVNHPESFGTLESLKSYVGRHAPVSYPLSLTRKASEEEKQLAGEYAMKTIQLVIDVIATYERTKSANS